MGKKKILLFIVAFGTLVLLNSCATTKRNLVYFSNLQDSVINSEPIVNQKDIKIQPGDALAIKVTTLNPQSNILYNSGTIPITSIPLNNSNSISGLPSGASSTATLGDGYLVDKEGDIDFPILGQVKVGGLSREEAQRKMVELISKTDKGTIVNISIQNFKITVIGEVLRPGSFNIANNKVNVLEALGLAGDMTPYAIRNNVLVIRETNGVRLMERVNLNDKNVFKSPFFYLQQNDIVYVQPENKLKAQQANSNSFRWIPLVTAAISALAIVLSRVL